MNTPSAPHISLNRYPFVRRRCPLHYKQEMRDNEDRSGGPSGDTPSSDARHIWNSCRGDLANLLWDNMLLTVAGGDDVADAVLPDENEASLTTLPGGTRRTATVRTERGKREGVNDPGEEREARDLGNKRRKEGKDVHGALLKLIDRC